MRTLAFLLCAVLVSACKTPPPIVDTATQVSKLSAKMDDSVSAYVAKLKTVRAADAKRLVTEEQSAARLIVGNGERVQILTLSGETQGINVFRSITTPPKEDPTAFLTTVPHGLDTGDPTFDSEPLRSVGKVAAGVAEPLSTKEQLLALVKFASTVNDNLEALKEESQKP